MSDNYKRGNSPYVYIPIVLTFVFLLGCFVVAIATMSDQTVNNYTVDKVSAFDLSSAWNDYSFKTHEENGIKYYVINPEDSSIQTTSTTTDTKSETTTTRPNSEKENKNKRIAYLTFDDGPSENTEKILDILDQYDVKATFFVIYHKNMDNKYKAIVDRGHTIALHSYSHNYKKIYKSESAYFDDLNKISNYVQKTTGVKTNIMRFPGGSSNTISNKYNKGIMKKLKKDVIDKGYIYHDWNVDSTDASGNNVDKKVLLANVKSSLTKYKKVDILMHDSGKLKQTTVEALPEIIEYVQSQGYSIERITEDSTPIRHNW